MTRLSRYKIFFTAWTVWGGESDHTYNRAHGEASIVTHDVKNQSTTR